MEYDNYHLAVAGTNQIIEIVYLDKILDLHNAGQFIKIEYNVKKLKLILYWNYYFDYFAENSATPFQLEFNGVNYLNITPRDEEMPTDEDDCMEEIVIEDNDKIIFSFMGGMKIAVGCISTKIIME